jgi:hypothetical protein
VWGNFLSHGWEIRNDYGEIRGKYSEILFECGEIRGGRYENLNGRYV